MVALIFIGIIIFKFTHVCIGKAVGYPSPHDTSPNLEIVLVIELEIVSFIRISSNNYMSVAFGGFTSVSGLSFYKASLTTWIHSRDVSVH